ncbi:MAG TPA: CorA family divalent cation transporter [Candidatus Paceibacterota bacterium]
MHARHHHGHITWIDLESPNALEVRQIATEFDIAEGVAEELISPTTKARAEFYADYVYIVLQFPAVKHSHKSRQQEIDFVIGQDFLITARYETVDALHKFSKVFEAQAALNTAPPYEHAGFLFYYMLRKIYHGLDNELDLIRHELTLIEEHIFTGLEVEMVQAISKSARALMNLRQTIEPHREILRALEESGEDFFGADFGRFLRELLGEYYRVHNHIMRTTDFLHELRETNNSLLSTKQNETMKIFTIMAFFTFPLALLIDVLAYESPYNPIHGRPFDFWIVVGLVLGGLFLMFLFFKHKKWL